MKHRLPLILAAVALAAFAAACDGDNGSTPTPSPDQTPGFTPAADDGSPAPSPKVEPVPERTGDEALDAIVEGFLRHDTKNLLLPNLRYSVLPCGVEPGMGGSPPCRADQETGAPVEVMPFSACEFGYYRPHEFEPILAEFAQQNLYGVFAATPEVRFPGDYVLILVRPRPDDPSMEIASEVTVEEGRIVGVHASCVLTPEDLVQEHHLGEPIYAP
jgi:hypothetical protein